MKLSLRRRPKHYTYLVAYVAPTRDGHRLGRCVFSTSTPVKSLDGIEAAEKVILANGDNHELTAPLLITGLVLLEVTRGGGA